MNNIHFLNQWKYEDELVEDNIEKWLTNNIFNAIIVNRR